MLIDQHQRQLRLRADQAQPQPLLAGQQRAVRQAIENGRAAEMHDNAGRTQHGKELIKPKRWLAGLDFDHKPRADTR